MPKASKFLRANRETQRTARRQHGLVRGDQFAAHHVNRQAQSRAVAAGHIERLRPNVFVYGGAPRTWRQTVAAAVFAGGTGAEASHATCCALHDLPGGQQSPLEVAVARRRLPRLVGAVVHRRVVHDESSHLDGIAVTPARRLPIDMSSRLTDQQLGALVDAIVARRLATIGEIVQECERHAPARGRSRARLRRVLAARAHLVADYESHLEDFVFDAIRRHGLPEPVLQHWIRLPDQRFRADGAYPDRSIAIEPVGYAPRRSRAAFDADRQKMTALASAGWTVLQFTSADSSRRIADRVVEALGVRVPTAGEDLTYHEWKRRRDG